MIAKALEFALNAHQGMMRKGTQIPYITHPIDVMNILMKEGFSETLQIAGLLHDTIEDTSINLDDIRSIFGSEVAQLVDTVSENKMLSWEDRKSHTINHIHLMTIEAKALLFADKLANLRSIHEEYLIIGDQVFERFNRGKKLQLKYYEDILNKVSDFIGMGMDFEYRRILRGLQQQPAYVFENNQIEEFKFLKHSLSSCSGHRYIKILQYLSTYDQDSDSSLTLGLCYARGNETSIDHNQAMMFLKKAMEQGSSDAPIYLSQYYIEGIYVEESYQEALDLLVIGRRRGSDLGILKECIVLQAIVDGVKVRMKTSVDVY